MRQDDVEGVGHPLAVLDGRSCRATHRLDRRAACSWRRAGPRCAAEIGDDGLRRCSRRRWSSVISFAGTELLLEVRERDDFARDRTIAGEALKRSLSRELFLLRHLQRRPLRPARRADELPRAWARRDPPAAQARCGRAPPAASKRPLAEQLRSFVGAAAELARAHRLRLRRGRADHQLRGREIPH